MAPPAYSALITLLTTSALIHFTAAQPPPAKASSPSLPSPPAPGCVGELVLFSPCLSFVSSPPNNRSKTAPSKCCDAFIAAINSGDGPCLCYLLRQPRLLGFPVNGSRVLSLSSVCFPDKSSRRGNLQAICSGSSQARPPFKNGTVSGVSNTSHSGPNNQSTPFKSLPPNSNNTRTPSSFPSDTENSSTKANPPAELNQGQQTPSEAPSSVVVDQLSGSFNSTSQKDLLPLVLLLILICL
ncbi:non-specific lipid transfer protein GPI-anchored 25 [Cannabis sativa]|uniref:Bifunctional inhibitor/plant lipid transfer protein/seed storage helical domain-containing protein n=1 Tax=Cannabis sativa TaxID=3483 RepID=A0A803Q1B5_CANSA|nr:non-specific lipid transfer protein GPI-anchored 25 [Cannabis sativa]